MSGAEVEFHWIAAAVSQFKLLPWDTIFEAISELLIGLASLVAIWAICAANNRWEDQKEFERNKATLYYSRTSASMLIAASIEIRGVIQSIVIGNVREFTIEAALAGAKPATVFYNSSIYDRIDVSSIRLEDTNFFVELVNAHRIFHQLMTLEQSPELPSANDPEGAYQKRLDELEEIYKKLHQHIERAKSSVLNLVDKL